MKPTETPSLAPHLPGSDRTGTAAKREAAEKNPGTEEQAFYAAQKVALADLRAYHANRPKRKR